MTQSTRPWGTYTVLHDAPDHKVKLIEVNPGHRLSLQSHKQRDEHWFVVSGIAAVQLDEKIIMVGAGDHIDIKRGQRHRVANQGDQLLRFIEIQTGTYFGEDDITRYEDDYNRAGQTA